MRRVFLIMTILLLFGSVFVYHPAAAYNTPVTGVEVYLQDNVVARPVKYIIRFKTGHILYGGRDTVAVKFPEAIPLSSNIDKYNVSINNHEVAGLDYSGGVLRLLVPEAINIIGGELVEIAIASGVINNPQDPGTYRVTVSTSQDSLEVESAPFEITDYEYPNGVSKPRVRVGIDENSSAPEYKITFKTSPNGRLEPGSTISITFPVGTQMPAFIDRKEIKINNTELFYQPLIEGRKVTLMVPSITVAAGGAVEIIISPAAEIIRPADTGYNTLTVSTSAEPREITSLPWEVAGGTSRNDEARIGLGVTVIPDGTGQTASYTITINNGLLRPLNHTVNNLVIAFPPGTVLPNSIAPEQIKINGAAADGCLVNKHNNSLVIIFPQAYPAEAQLIIAIDRVAGIKNPLPAQHKLEIGIIGESRTVLSDWFNIYAESSTGSLPNNNTTQPPASNPVTGSGRQIILRVDSNLAHVDGVLKVLDAAPAMINNVTMVPLRFVADCLGAQTEYDSLTASATVKLDGKEIVLWENSGMARVNGVYVSMNAVTTNINNRLMIPLRFVSENLGAQVDWEGTTRVITITTGSSASSGGSGAATPPPAAAPYPIGYKVYPKSEHSYVNLRSGPSTGYPLAGSLYRGEEATIMEVNGEWYKVKLPSGLEAWVASWVVDIRS